MQIHDDEAANDNEYLGEYMPLAHKIMFERFGDATWALETFSSTSFAICTSLQGKINGYAPAEMYDCAIEDSLLRAAGRTYEANSLQRWYENYKKKELKPV